MEADTMDEQFDVNQNVMTPRGPGKVVYRRMGAPDYTRVVVYSVKLEGVNHSGAIFSVDEVKKA
jgi:hypothetical protein